jgi:hypothetical protein
VSGKFYYFKKLELAVGSWQLAVGSWQLTVGSWQLAVDSWQLAIMVTPNNYFNP